MYGVLNLGGIFWDQFGKGLFWRPIKPKGAFGNFQTIFPEKGPKSGTQNFWTQRSRKRGQNPEKPGQEGAKGALKKGPFLENP